jgi:DNA-binding protein
MSDVLIGQKNVTAYVTAVLSEFQSGSNEVIVKARGNSIKRAIDTVEVLRRKFLTSCKIADVKIGTDVLEDKETKMERNVSFIEIKLKLKT